MRVIQRIVQREQLLLVMKYFPEHQILIIPLSGSRLEHRSDDLCKAQGGDGQVVALQTQHRQADEPGKEGGHASAQQDGQQHPQDQARGGVHPAELRVYYSQLLLF